MFCKKSFKPNRDRAEFLTFFPTEPDSGRVFFYYIGAGSARAKFLSFIPCRVRPIISMDRAEAGLEIS